MIDATLLPAIREALRVNEIGDSSPYELSYAKYGQSGASFGVFQGDTHVDPTARTALNEVLVAANVDPAIISRILAALSQACPNGSPLTDADEKLTNEALSSTAGKAIVDKMDDRILNVILAEVENVVSAAESVQHTLPPDAQLCVALWVNMTGAPATLSAWIKGTPTNGAFSPPGPVVTRADILRYLTVSKYFTLHPRNLRHFNEAVDAGGRLLPQQPAEAAAAEPLQVAATPLPAGAQIENAVIPLSDGFVGRLIDIAETEWHRFGDQTYDVNNHPIQVGHKEGEDTFFQRIGTYWAEGTKTFGIDGTNHDWPWSAAFISWIMKRAGAEDRFRYSTQHSVYIYQSVLDHKNGRADAGFWGWRLNERKPALGDLICWSRQNGIDFDHQENGVYLGHTDVVVAVRDKVVEVIGGNVGDSVTRRPIPLNDQGFLVPVDNGERLFGLMENRIS